jgi:hypothetical protein
MPYFVYRIAPQRKLTLIETHTRYQEAKALVRRLRQEEASGEDDIRMIFAQHQSEAERLLATPRDDRVIGED